MATYKNLDFNEQGSVTRIKFAQGNKPSGNWIECDESEIDCDSLYVQAGIRYFGLL